MLRPMAIARSRETSKTTRFTALAAAGAIEIALVAALVSGLAARIVKDLPHELTMVDLSVPVTPPPDMAPPAKPELVKPQMPTVPVPVIRIARHAPAPTITVVATPQPVVSAPAPVVVVAEPQLPVGIPSTTLQSVAGTHTIPPYPAMAQRLGEHGQVQLHIAIDASGQVTAVSVSKSSGSERLDDAARAWVLANWKYRAATQNGAGVASETEALVVFDLKNVR